MNWGKVVGFVRKMSCFLRNAACWLCRNILELLEIYWSADFWRGLWKFIKDMAKGDLKRAYKRTIKRVFKNEKDTPIPLKRGLLRSPGGNVFEGIIMRVVIISMATGVFVGVCLGMAVNSGLFVLFFLLLLIFLLPILVYQADNYGLGYLGERSVAEKLAQYGSDPAWRVFHSFLIPESKGGDIDHIIVCSNGVFCVETKAWRRIKKVRIEDGKIFLDNEKEYREKLTKQANGNAARLQEFLSAKCSFEVRWVVPVIFFVNTFVSDYVTDKLIVGNSERIKDVFDKFGKVLKAPVFNAEQIEEISNVLEKENRSDIEMHKESLS